MLRIRLTRTGKKSQPSYRVVVAEHTSPVKSKFVEIVGHYNLSSTPRQLVVDQDRVNYWVSVGAKPTDSVAALLKSMGVQGMDTFIVKSRTLKRKKRNGSDEVATSPAATVSVAVEAPATEEAPVVTEEIAAEETPAAPVEEVVAEAPVAEEAPAEEEAPKDQPAE